MKAIRIGLLTAGTVVSAGYGILKAIEYTGGDRRIETVLLIMAFTTASYAFCVLAILESEK